ncbi:PadR family transcriptional regulator [Gemmatimonadota bacterium]
MAKKKADLLQGTLDLIVLKTLAVEPLHGWGISKRVREMSDGVLDVHQGSLYPALYRLRDRGLIRSEWEVTNQDRRVKVYDLTPKGRKALAEEQEGWRVFTAAVDRILANS